MEALRKWLENSRKPCVHDVVGLSHHEAAENRHDLIASLRRRYVAAKDESAVKNLRCRLQVLDNPAERFARILNGAIEPM
jgi:hypothetical protein